MTVERLSLMGRRAGRSEDGQDTTEYVLVIILLALVLTAGIMVWSRSVDGAYGGVGDCIAGTTSTGAVMLPGARRTVGRPDEATGTGAETGTGTGTAVEEVAVEEVAVEDPEAEGTAGADSAVDRSLARRDELRDRLSKLALLLLITVVGGGLLFWLGAETPTSRAGWIAVGAAMFVWLMLILSGFGRPIVRFLRILLG